MNFSEKRVVVCSLAAGGPGHILDGGIEVAVGAILLLMLSMVFKNLWILVFTGLCPSVMGPAIYTLALDKGGVYTAQAVGILMTGVVGGGLISLLQGILAAISGGSRRWTWWLGVLGEWNIFYYGGKGYRVKPGETQPE